MDFKKFKQIWKIFWTSVALFLPLEPRQGEIRVFEEFQKFQELPNSILHPIWDTFPPSTAIILYYRELQTLPMGRQG